MAASDFNTRELSELSGIGVEEPKSVDLDSLPEQHSAATTVPTDYGPVTVVVQGDISRPVILTYHDVGLDPHSCFNGFMNYPPTKRLLDVMCVLHITAPGQEPGARDYPISERAFPTVDELAEQVGSVADYFKLRDFVGLGVGAGANIMLRYALNNQKRVHGLVLFGVSIDTVGWHEWSYRKLSEFQLRASGGAMTQFTEQLLLETYFSTQTLEENVDLVDLVRKHFNTRLNAYNFRLFQASYLARSALLPRLTPEFKPDMLLFAGNGSWHMEETEECNGAVNRSRCAYVKEYHAGDLVHEEHPHKVLEAFLLFLQGLSFAPAVLGRLNEMSRDRE